MTGQKDDFNGVSDGGFDVREQAGKSEETVTLEVRLEGLVESFPVWHGELHVADPTLLPRVREGLQHAGFGAAIPQRIIGGGEADHTAGQSQKHRQWHLDHPGQSHLLLGV